MIDLIMNGLARSTIAVALSAGFAWLLLSVFRPQSPRVHKVVWFVVILQAACWQPIGLTVLGPPSMMESLAVVDSSTEPSVTTTFDEPSTLIPADAPDLVVEQSPLAIAPAPAVSSPTRQWSWKPILFGVWIVGGLLLVFLGVADYLRLQRQLVREVSPIPAQWIADWQSLPNRGCELIATQTLGPLAIRTLYRAVVAVPRELGDSLTCEQRRAVLSHELSHLRSGDPFWTLLVWLATSVQWFNPFVWLANRRFHAAAELACDDRLDEPSRLPLAEVLLSLAQPNPRTALAMTGGTLAARIRALATPKQSEQRWKSPLVALLVVAGLSIGWIRLEAKQPPKKESTPSQDVEKKKEEETVKLNAEIDLKVDEFQRRFQEKSAEFEKLKQRNPVAKKPKKSVKTGEPEKNWIDDTAAKIEQKRREMSAVKEEIQKTPNDEKLRAKHLSLQNDVTFLNDQLADTRNKLEFLVLRALRQTDPQDNDALALERTLGYLAAREPKFGVQEVLPNEEHVETEAVLKLEALLKRNIKPQANETYRQALERILQTPSERRKRMAEMRASLKEVKSDLPSWEDRRDYWLSLVADLLESVANNKVHQVWRPRMDGVSGKQGWTARYFYWAAIRHTRDNNSAGLVSLQTATRDLGTRDADRAALLQHLLTFETICKANLPHDEGVWQILKDYFVGSLKWPTGKDPRHGDLIWMRIHATLKACENSIHRERGRHLRTLIGQDSDARIPAAGIDKLMELEGVAPNARVQFFLNRQVSVNFQGRSFANAFSELRSLAAVPMVVVAPGWESNLRPITLNADAKWIDVLREVARQVGLPCWANGGLTIVGDFTNVGEAKIGQPVQTSSERLWEAQRRSRSAPPSWRQKLEKPTFMNLSETPTSQALLFLTTQTNVPIRLLADKDFNQDMLMTTDVDRVPLAVALEAMCPSIGCVWIPVGDSIVIVTQKRKAEMEGKAVEFREQLKRLNEASEKGDAAAKALTSKTFVDFNETPLAQGLQFFETQHPGLQVESRVKERDTPINFAVRDVPLAEALTLIAWNHELKLTFEGSKAVLSDK